MRQRATHPNRKRTRIARYAAATLALLLVAAGYTLLHTPDWYRPPAIDPDDRQVVRDNLVRAERQFTESLLAGESFEYHIFQDVVNQWITARHEIFPLIDEFAPPVLADPFILFRRESITLAGRHRILGLDAILSIDIQAAWEDDAIVLRATAIRCGLLSLSPGFGGLGLDRATYHEAGSLWPGSPEMAGDFINGFRIDADAWWKNGGVNYRVTGLHLGDGRLDLHVRPLDDQVSTRRSRHRASD